MDEALKKKLIGAATAGVAAFMFGGSQIIELDDRIAALEAIHPEIAQAELDALAEELENEESPPALGKPGMSAPPIEAPDSLEESDEDQIEAEEAEAEAQPLIGEEGE